MDMNVNKKTNMMVMAALMICLIVLATMFFKMPIPMTHGYVHMGDAMVFVSMLVLGRKYGAAAAAVGSAMGDIFGGFAIWAPWTLAAKGGMVLIAATVIMRCAGSERKNHLLLGVPLHQFVAMTCGGLYMAAVYYLAEGLMYGNWIVPLVAGVPWNIAQFAVGIVIAVVIEKALAATPAKKFLYEGMLLK